MRNLLAAAAVALVSTLAVTGCAPAWSDTTTFSTAGEKGALTFEYDSCLFGCGLDRPALQGSAVTLEVKGGSAGAALVARLDNSAVGVIANQHFSCDEGTCRLFVDIETKQAGETRVEVVDKAGALVDGVALRVHAAARIAVDVHGHAAGADGFFAVKQGDKLEVESTVFDAAGDKLAFSHHGVAQVYADRAVVAPDSEFDILGTSDVEKAVAVGIGETTLALRAVGAERLVKFRVTK